MKTIYLIGFMGSGKSTIGQELSKKLSRSYIDTDNYIEKKHGKISRIFQKMGEEVFRTYETQAIKQTKSYEIISTGGGIIERKENLQEMNRNGIIIYLSTSFDEIYERLGHDENRPLWSNNLEEVKKLYDRRMPLYKIFSNYTVITDGKSIQENVQEIKKIISSIESAK